MRQAFNLIDTRVRQRPSALRPMVVGLASLGLAAGVGAFPAGAQSTKANAAINASRADKAAPTYYVSLGDSYAVGYEPGLGATTGYTGYVAKKSHLTLVNFGCAGATTISILDTVGCPHVLPRTAGSVAYPTTTQAAAAETFITAHRGHIGLITVSIGGNDVTACAAQPNPIPCVGTAVSGIETNVAALVVGVRTAAGSKVPLIGLTYPDVLLGAYVYPSLPATPARIALAKESVVAFEVLLNPALKTAYGSGGGTLVDVTTATDAYTSLARTVALAPYGTIPLAVAKVCALTWFCKLGDIHATTKGYTLIGKLVAARYAIMRKG